MKHGVFLFWEIGPCMCELGLAKQLMQAFITDDSAASQQTMSDVVQLIGPQVRSQMRQLIREALLEPTVRIVVYSRLLELQSWI